MSRQQPKLPNAAFPVAPLRKIVARLSDATVLALECGHSTHALSDRRSDNRQAARCIECAKDKP